LEGYNPKETMYRFFPEMFVTDGVGNNAKNCWTPPQEVGMSSITVHSSNSYFYTEKRAVVEVVVVVMIVVVVVVVGGTYDLSSAPW